MILSEMITEVRERLAETDEADYWTDAFITSSLNEATRRFCASERWNWMFTTQDNIVVAQDATTIELIDDVVLNRHFSLILTRDHDNEIFVPDRISPVQAARVEEEYQRISLLEPRVWYLESTITNVHADGEIAVAQRIRIFPAADAAYTAKYHFFRRPVTLVDDGDEPDIPEDYHDAIVARACGMLWLKELDAHSKAQEQFELYGEVLAQAKRDQAAQAPDDPIMWGRRFRRHPDRDLRHNLPLHLGA